MQISVTINGPDDVPNAKAMLDHIAAFGGAAAAPVAPVAPPPAVAPPVAQTAPPVAPPAPAPEAPAAYDHAEHVQRVIAATRTLGDGSSAVGELVEQQLKLPNLSACSEAQLDWLLSCIPALKAQQG